MAWYDRDDTRYLKRIAEALELIAAYVVSTTTPTVTGVELMAFNPNPNVGDTGTGTVNALDANGNVVTTATGALSATSSDPTVYALVDNGASAGVDNVAWTAVAAGTVTLSGSYTDPVTGDVITSGAGNPQTITVAAVVDQVTSVSLV